MDAIQLFSFDVDFQRDIQEGHRFLFLYEELYDQDERYVRAGDLLMARLDLTDRSVPVWRYEKPDGSVDWYDDEARSVRKTLLKTPVDGARISSGYGLRTHPILGYTKAHKGIDFAAPVGTPIHSSGDGTIVNAGWHDSYGYYVRVRHANHYQTLYAHMSSIARGIRRGIRVAQGQTIGYVGSTGMSTGPHCHYEVIYYGGHVNPLTLKFPPGHVLDGEEKILFLNWKDALQAGWF